MSDLAERQCIPCRGGVPPLEGAALKALLAKLDEGWEVVDEHHLQRAYKFRNFAEALAYVNGVGAIAEDQNHHPDLLLAWGRVEVKIWTHKIDGLTESDFVFAAKADRVWADRVRADQARS